MFTLDCRRILAETFVAAVEQHRQLASTNDRAKALAAAAELELPLLVLTDRQTAGRGRGGNRWWSAEGSLTFSLLIGAEHLPAERAAAPLVSLAAAIAVVETVSPLAADHRVGIHWPNDVYLGQRKLSGILIEALSNRRQVVGIGLNLCNQFDDAPVELRQSAVALCQHNGQLPAPTTILVTLLQQLEQQLGCLRAAPQQVAAHADRLCLQHGQRLTLESGGKLVHGCCMGIDGDGCLLLESPQGPLRFASGVLKRND